MKRSEIVKYLSKLKELDDNNEHLPSPHEIEEYMEECDLDTDLEIYDELFEYHKRAYEQ